MKNLNILKTLLLVVFLTGAMSANAQKTITYVKKVFIASGGDYTNPTNKVTMIAYDPATKKDTIFDSIPGGSVTQILLDTDGIAYVATDSTLVKYDLNSLKRLGSVIVYSVRYLALYKTYICATIGYDGNFNDFKMFNKSDLSLVFKDRSLKTWCEGLTVQGDSAYIAMQGTYPYDTGKIAVLDLVNQNVKRIINLGAALKGIGQIYSSAKYVVGTSQYYSQSNPYDTFYISKISLKSGGVTTTLLEGLNSNIPFALYDDSLYADYESGLGSYNVNSKSSALYIKPAPLYAAAALDTINKLFYTTGLDFSKPTKAYIYNYNGKVLDSFKVGASPQGIAILYGTKSGINEPQLFGIDAQLFPNPAKTAIYLSGFSAKGATVSLIDIAGRVVFTENRDIINGERINIPVDGLPNGMYFVTVRSEEGAFSRKFIKN